MIPLNNPITEFPDDLETEVQELYDSHKELEDVVDVDLLIRGARVAQMGNNHLVRHLTAAEKQAIKIENRSGFLDQTKDLKVTILTTACAAITQGWQQSTINASSPGWQAELNDGIGDWKQHKVLAGLIDASPWLSGSIIGTWLSDPLQEGRFGRRPALFISAVFCAACVIGTARCETWQQLLVCRILLGIGIGAKASVAPIFAAEAAADHIRGRLLMMWQLFDTFGVFIGFAAVWIVDRQWRILLGTSAMPAIILLFLVFLCPESPRFLIRRDDYKAAFLSLRQLKGTDIQAARDLYYIHRQLQAEAEMLRSKKGLQNGASDRANYKYPYQQYVRNMSFPRRVWSLWSIPRNRRACMAAFVVMASQQLCGINVLSFYSTTLFDHVSSPNGETNSLHSASVAWLNFGFGLANFLFTIPAYRYIDYKGRRMLLLCSLAGMCATLACISGFFRLSDDTARIGTVSSFSIVLFTFVYGIGAGPVPFTFSAEVFPLAFREVGMSFSVMVNFLGLGLLVMFVPKLTEAFGSNGNSNLLFLFTGLNALAFALVFFLVPSGTECISLEETNRIFETKTMNHIKGHLSVLRINRPPREQTHAMEGVEAAEV
ncbi:MFS transporter [Aspergillus steynii IBT 23096]|uniref:MFS transporter n=1 Tax=Aspergillus steynii IBT 23096 TaxID=1392250 RepID=A0A2I2G0N6_9EURO|nr:MFS transporter [Aspergillus steynii IBT 23096]PLB46431.1 MFS transporter [Aspergillus steynii IBT 23096]